MATDYQDSSPHWQPRSDAVFPSERPGTSWPAPAHDVNAQTDDVTLAQHLQHSMRSGSALPNNTFLGGTGFGTQSGHDYLAANSLAAQLQQQLGLAPGPSSATSRTMPGASVVTPAQPLRAGNDLHPTSRQGSGTMASTSLAVAKRGSDPNLQQQQQQQQQQHWGEPQAATQGLQRGHPSQEDVFSAVGGLELPSNASARDLTAETSGPFVDQQQQPPHRQGSAEYPFHQTGMVHATSSGSLSSVMPNGPLISHSASTASLQNLAMGEPPPCRTIFVRNIDPNTDDMQLQATFEKCGDIRTLYNASKLQGYVLITYYDGRAGNYAKAALDGVLLNGRQLRIEPSGPGQKIHDKDTQSATVSVFGVNEAVADADYRDYMQDLAGDVASVSRSTTIPGCRLAEYWDVRSAHLALNKLNGSQARVPTIVEGPSQLPANLRNVQSSHVLQSAFPAANQQGPPPADDAGSFRPSSWDNSPSPLFTEESLRRGNSADMLAGVLRQPGGAELIRQELLRTSSSSNALQALHAAHALGHSGSSGSLSGISSRQQSASQTGISNMGQSASHPNLAHAAGGSPSRQNSIEPGSPRLLNAGRRDLSAPHLPQQAWQSNAAGGLPQRGASFSTGDLAGLYDGSMLATAASGAQQGLRGVGSTGSLWNHNQMGSPTGQSSAPWTAHTGGLPQQGSASSLSAAAEGAAWGAYQGTEAALRAQMALGMLPPTATNGLDAASLNAVAQRLAAGGGYTPRSGGLSGDAQAILQQHAALGLNPRQSAALLAQMQAGATGRIGGSQGGLRSMGGPLTGSYSRSRGSREDLPSSGSHSGRRTADPLAEAERKAQQEKMYALDYERVMAGEDKRTTIMLKNIPNKYTQKMLLSTIDEEFRGTYDFFYLPIDFKNKCNVGYAFINLLRPETIVPLAQRFNRKKWERFNSEKVCHITYARIQGKGALVTHFQNSSLLHEDKRCRPILFKSDGSQASDQEAFPTSTSRSSLRGNPPRPPSPPTLPPLGPTQQQQQQQQQQEPSLNSSLLTSTQGMHGSSLAPGGPIAS